MPRVNVITTLNNSRNDIALLNNYIISSKSLDAKYQHMISEIIMLRLFSILEHSISEFAFKFACGALYRNGNSPRLLRHCSSLQDANSQMLSYGRRTPLAYHRWTKENLIQKSIQYVLDTSDSFFTQIQAHANMIDEMRIVRNHIAHKSANTKREYSTLLTGLYGGNPRITAGAFLTSTSRQPRANIDKYIISTNVILNDISNG